MDRHRFATRCVVRLSAFGPHGATPVAPVRRPTADSARRAASSAGARASRKLASDGVAPFLAWPALRRAANRITNPLVCWLVMTVTLCAWHLPAVFDFALRSPRVAQNRTRLFFWGGVPFLVASRPPFPSRPQWPLWSVPLYLLAADLVNTALSVILTFSDHVLYPQYLDAPRLFGTTALGDQSCAGLIMWVPGSLVFLIPAAVIAFQFSPRPVAPSHLVRPQKIQLAARSSAPGYFIFPFVEQIRLTPQSAFIKQAPFDLLICARRREISPGTVRSPFHAGSVARFSPRGDC